jgi:riboflavin synthase
VLGRKRPGDVVNLETDVIGKYVEKLLLPGRRPKGTRLPAASPWILARNGF